MGSGAGPSTVAYTMPQHARLHTPHPRLKIHRYSERGDEKIKIKSYKTSSNHRLSSIMSIRQVPKQQQTVQGELNQKLYPNVSLNGSRSAAKPGLAPTLGAQKSVVREIGTIDVNDFKKAIDPLELAGRFIDSYLEKDLKYPELDRLGNRMCWYILCQNVVGIGTVCWTALFELQWTQLFDYAYICFEQFCLVLYAPLNAFIQFLLYLN